MKMEIQIVRDEIARYWAELASKRLSIEERKPIRERLQQNISALRQLKESRSASKPTNERVQRLGINAATLIRRRHESRAHLSRETIWFAKFIMFALAVCFLAAVSMMIIEVNMQNRELTLTPQQRTLPH
jgi:hypothetical protein